MLTHWIKKNLPPFSHLRAITQEASSRSFFRLEMNNKPYVLMVYPEPNPDEIFRIQKFTSLYILAGLKVPRIIDSFENQAILLEDLGRRYFQYYFKKSPSRQKLEMAKKGIWIIKRIATIPAEQTPLSHDLARQQFEMDFFITHYLDTKNDEEKREELRSYLYQLARQTCAPVNFSHRDFHSRNLIYAPDRYGIVDFQDSMRTHPLYDLASFLWDAYLPWTPSLRSHIIKELPFPANTTQTDLETVALQRTIKALGTFAYQIKVKKKMAYRQYICRVIQSILQNPQFKKVIPASCQNLFLCDTSTIQKKCTQDTPLLNS